MGKTSSCFTYLKKKGAIHYFSRKLFSKKSIKLSRDSGLCALLKQHDKTVRVKATWWNKRNLPHIFQRGKLSGTEMGLLEAEKNGWKDVLTCLNRPNSHGQDGIQQDLRTDAIKAWCKSVVCFLGLSHRGFQSNCRFTQLVFTRVFYVCRID